MSIAAVVLAAGASRRLGRPKQTVEINGETLLARAVRIAREAELSPVIAVIADPTLAETLQTLGAIVVLNPDASEGIASSIRTGIAAAKDHAVAGAVLMTCDQVAITADHLRSLCAQPESITGSLYARTVGIPAYFPATAFGDLLQLHGDQGARGLLHHARTIHNPALHHDIDTKTDLERVRQLIENKQLS